MTDTRWGPGPVVTSELPLPWAVLRCPAGRADPERGGEHEDPPRTDAGG